MDVSQHTERDDGNISRFMRLKCKEWKDIVNWERKERIYLRVNENILTFTRILNEDKTKKTEKILSFTVFYWYQISSATIKIMSAYNGFTTTKNESAQFTET